MVELFEIDYDNVHKSTVRKKRDESLKRKIEPYSDLFKSWYLRTCFDFLNKSKLRNSEELLIERFSDFILNSLINQD